MENLAPSAPEYNLKAARNIELALELKRIGKWNVC